MDQPTSYEFESKWQETWNNQIVLITNLPGGQKELDLINFLTNSQGETKWILGTYVSTSDPIVI